jgi:hypothetical protein
VFHILSLNLHRADKKAQPAEVGKIHLSMFVTRQRVTIDKSPLWTAIKEKAVTTVKELLKNITFRELYAFLTSLNRTSQPSLQFPQCMCCRNEVDEYGENVLHAAVNRKDWDQKGNDILIVLLEDERVDANHANEECVFWLLISPSVAHLLILFFPIDPLAKIHLSTTFVKSTTALTSLASSIGFVSAVLISTLKIAMERLPYTRLCSTRRLK